MLSRSPEAALRINVTMQSYSETLKTLHVFVLILQGIVWLFNDRFVGLLKLKTSISAVAFTMA